MMSAGTSGASAAPAIGTATASMAAVMTRFRPNTSATAPVNGAVRAMASALAVMMVLISAAPTPNSRASAGSSACGEYRLRKAQKPAVAMATLRGSKRMRCSLERDHDERRTASRRAYRTTRFRGGWRCPCPAPGGRDDRRRLHPVEARAERVSRSSAAWARASVWSGVPEASMRAQSSAPRS